MILDDLRDQLGERWQAALGQAQESSIYISLREKYDNLAPPMQKLTLFLGSVVMVFLLFLIPWSYISSGNTSLEDFENKKTTIRELFRVSRYSGELASAPPNTPPSVLQSRAQSELQQARLQPEQIKSVEEFDNSGPQASAIIPKSVIQKGIKVSLSKLNLRQVIALGSQLQTLERGVKMVGMDVMATSEDPHFFDVTYKLVTFTLPVEATPETGKKNPRGRK
jgi:hypothetical protein